MTRTFNIRTTEDAVACIAALATEVIADGNHPGHDLETVFDRITSGDVLCLIRQYYDRRVGNGESPRQAVIGVGQSLIAHYCQSAGIPPTN
ncbi:hypothetical protein [Streptomyces sp. TRM68367]|uniref:hypothetical protein n=1 Tax=Streptomyces sp. TRM68367 TaxID=2758415 RepID=UPI00165BD9FC|nr:hypothetical protein [Streptomyces sp. TRM68367]MBC9730698.1 hypothetical protein [Streptomyces sp. TRM68367]